MSRTPAARQNKAVQQWQFWRIWVFRVGTWIHIDVTLASSDSCMHQVTVCIRAQERLCC